MSFDNYKLLDGREIRYDNIRIPKAQAICRVAKAHPYVSDVACRITTKGDIIIFMTIDSEVPDMPVYDIHEKEPVAVICGANDNRTPEVFALRKDFPLGLSHSNAMPYDHPVSLCVIDIPFQDYRTTFSAFAFIESIRSWFAKNAIGQLHEKDRPLEVYFNTEEFSYFPIEPDLNRFYRNVRYSKITEATSIIEETEANQSNYTLLLVPVGVNVSRYVHRVPKKLGDLRDLKTYNGRPFIETVIGRIGKTPYLRESNKPLMLGLIMPLSREKGEKYEEINLFVLRIACPVATILKKAFTRYGKRDDDYLDNLDVTLSFILDSVTCGRLCAWNGLEKPLKSVTFLGTGALGSQILDHFVRRGQAETFHLIDADMVAPHNLARHTLDIKDVMNYKVKSLKRKYQGIGGLKIHTYPQDFLSCKERALDQAISKTDIVIDASTSVGVERHLALDLNKFSTRRCTTFLNPKGTDIVLMVEDQDRNNRLDLLEMDYYRNVIIQEALEHHLDVPGTQRTNIFNCRAESVIMDFDNIAALSSIVSSQIPRAMRKPEATLAIWQMESDKGNVSRLDLIVADWTEFYDGAVTVSINGNVLMEMDQQRDAKLQSPKPVETGGSFLGTYDKDRNRLYVVYMIPAPEDSVEAGTSYIRGVKGLSKKIERIKKRTGDQILYLGEWHSHPKDCGNEPSPSDKQLFLDMSRQMSLHDYPFVMGILSDEGLNLKVQM